MHCPKCGGLMIVEQFCDLQDDTGRLCFYGSRCMICGEILDPVILMNRREYEPSLIC